MGEQGRELLPGQAREKREKGSVQGAVPACQNKDPSLMWELYCPYFKLDLQPFQDSKLWMVSILQGYDFMPYDP